jgi:DNA (cytosine-5)-methyltransferase 1
MGRCLDALAEIGAVGIEWAMLDAQHFGVPQRRKRVFLVAWFDPRVGGGGEIFPVRESCGRDSEKGEQAGQDSPSRAARSVDAARGLGSVTDQGIAQALLTPSGERLMGWPDDHTRWAADGQEIADTNRYRMCGNGVAAPVAEWVARRLSATGFRDAG